MILSRTNRRFSDPPAPQRGIAAVEFALTVFLLLLIGAGLAEFGRAFWYYESIVKGTRDAARHLSTIPTTSLPTAVAPTADAVDIVVRAAIAAAVPDFTAGNVSIACRPVTCAAARLPTDISTVTVTASYPLRIGVLFPFLAPGSSNGGGWAVTLNPHTTMRYMW